MLICVEGGRKETTPPPKKHTHRQKERQEKKVCCGSRRRRREKTERVSDYAILPTSLLPHGNIAWERSLSTSWLWLMQVVPHTHTETTVLAGFCRGSLLGPVVLYGAVNTPVWLVKVKNHKLVQSQWGRRCGSEQLMSSQRVLCSTMKGRGKDSVWCFTMRGLRRTL